MAVLSASARLTPRARPASLMAARAAIVPKVMIWATRSLPYFCATYSITSPLLVSAKSKSISGGSTRAGFKKRSKIRLYLIGSRLVISKRYATNEPAADPLPGPTIILLDLAQLTKSQTTKKYSKNPIFSITESSYSSRFLISGSTFAPYLFMSPASQSFLRYDSAVSFCGKGKRGSWNCPKGSSSSHMSAIFKVLDRASGVSLKRDDISSGDLKE